LIENKDMAAVIWGE